MSDITPTLASGRPQRPRTQLVATGFASAVCAMMMAGALGFYMARRHARDRILVATGLMVSQCPTRNLIMPF